MRLFIPLFLIFLCTSCNRCVTEVTWEQYKSEAQKSAHYYKKFYGSALISFHEEISQFPRSVGIKDISEIKDWFAKRTSHNLIRGKVLETIRFSPDLIMWNKLLWGDPLEWHNEEIPNKNEVMLFGSLAYEDTKGNKIYAAVSFGGNNLTLASPPKWVNDY